MKHRNKLIPEQKKKPKRRAHNRTSSQQQRQRDTHTHTTSSSKRDHSSRGAPENLTMVKKMGCGLSTPDPGLRHSNAELSSGEQMRLGGEIPQSSVTRGVAIDRSSERCR